MAAGNANTLAVLDWPGAVGLLGLGLLPELFPFVFGAGEKARRDWGFAYATCHFVLLPIASLTLPGGGIVQLVRGQREHRYRALFPIASAVAMLLMLVFEPINSWRAGVWL